MKRFDHTKYKPFPPIPMPHRRWPDQAIEQAPRWCAVDLRDGNQALAQPMDAGQKQRCSICCAWSGLKRSKSFFRPPRPRTMPSPDA